MSCQECGDLWWDHRCHICNTYLCNRCTKTATYIRREQQVLGVDTNPLKPCKVTVQLCPKCYQGFDPLD